MKRILAILLALTLALSLMACGTSGGSYTVATGDDAFHADGALTDSSGAVLASFTPAKRYTCVVVSAPGVAQDGTYTVAAGTQTQTVTMSSLIYGGGMGFGSTGGMGGFPGGNMPSDFDPSQQGGGFPGGQRPSGNPPTKSN